ncbi:hypothetical protein TRFO_34768 [Tritrichomonas foetus]|uniref:Bulb-type lectin domain-containing protein n=1 Tax=Tritrichomonas foetus TaxID=1144522 RepID=A0A1J4JNQ7_9EUKA|nr:hypothetical protein TRFO_34768 [Tritrichomonas foetus]|eukprot:OHS98900.1 hypothetical protein TRFO_34768 [Tritrichomonas foetus]
MMFILFILFISQIMDATNVFTRHSIPIVNGDEISIFSEDGRLYLPIFSSPSINILVTEHGSSDNTYKYEDSQIPAFRLSRPGSLIITANEDGLLIFGAIQFEDSVCTDKIWYTTKIDDVLLISTVVDGNYSVSNNHNLCIFYGGHNPINYTIVTKLDELETSKLTLHSENGAQIFSSKSFSTNIVSSGFFEFKYGSYESLPEFIRIMAESNDDNPTIIYNGFQAADEIIPGSGSKPASPTNESKLSNSTLIIIISIIGAGIALLIIISISLFILKKKRNNSVKYINLSSNANYRL